MIAYFASAAAAGAVLGAEGVRHRIERRRAERSAALAPVTPYDHVDQGALQAALVVRAAADEAKHRMAELSGGWVA